MTPRAPSSAVFPHLIPCQFHICLLVKYSVPFMMSSLSLFSLLDFDYRKCKFVFIHVERNNFEEEEEEWN